MDRRGDRRPRLLSRRRDQPRPKPAVGRGPLAVGAAGRRFDAVVVNHAEVARLLTERREDLARDLARLTERPVDPVGNLSFGKRIGDGTTEAVERINTTAAARSVAASIADVDRALAKL